jgi:putative glutamine amidotransferase
MARPLIGITLDRNEGFGPAQESIYELRENYCSVIWDAGGLPICLPCQENSACHFLEHVDGVVVSGGMFDIDPQIYGERPRSDLVLKPQRTEFELALTRAALERDMPVLGICGGLQIMGVAGGGKLFHDIRETVPDACEHMHDLVPDQGVHEVRLTPGTRLASMFPKGKLQVNSVHHQVLAEGTDDIIVSARAADGVIEAIEFPNKRFAIGVQWHPEYLVAAERAIFEELIDTARSWSQARAV